LPAMTRPFIRAIVCAAVGLAVALPDAAVAQVSPRDYQARRAALASSIGDGIVLAFGATEPDEAYAPYAQRPRFLYLTGYTEPEAALVLVKRGGQLREMLFVMPRDPASEVVTGARLGVEGARRRTGIDAREMTTLEATLDSLLSTDTALYVIGDYSPQQRIASQDDFFVERLAEKFPRVVGRSINRNVDVLRRIKNAGEMDLLRKSIAITVDAQREAMRAMRPGMNEFEIQALIEYTFRRNGADRPSFGTIVGSGPNSTTLHYRSADRFMNDGEVVVMDIGASYRGYAADVTRTVPVNGVFSPAQREIYQAVRDAQAAAERQAKVGALARTMSDSATASLTAALARFGLIESPAATYDCETPNGQTSCPQYRLYYMHSLGHGIGLDVHDPWRSGPVDVLTPGHAFTIEPGIYVRANTLDIILDTHRNRALKEKIRPAIARYANIGVRIEDDYLVTANDVEWISRAPREISEIEALMKNKSTGPAPRDPAKIEWYRATTPP
jgi:Xaa-Pro aminopeptidase